MATMAELIAIEHTHETAVITFLTGGMDWSSSLRLTDYSKAGVALVLLVFTLDIESVIACLRQVRPFCRAQT